MKYDFYYAFPDGFAGPGVHVIPKKQGGVGASSRFCLWSRNPIDNRIVLPGQHPWVVPGFTPSRHMARAVARKMGLTQAMCRKQHAFYPNTIGQCNWKGIIN